MRYIFIGGVEFSAHCLDWLLSNDVNIVEIMCPRVETAGFNADYSDLRHVAERHGREVHYFTKIRDEADRLARLKPDVIFVLGLSQIITTEILAIPTIGCLGSHPALLPRNRGRHPLIWALANGLEKSGLTMFWLDAGVDSGDIWAQKEFAIGPDDTATTLYEKIKELAVTILEKNIGGLGRGIIKRTPQNQALATNWRKRTKKDGEIDWRMSSERINNLVRALAKPYNGAHCVYQENEVVIHSVSVEPMDLDMGATEPGKVVVSGNNSLLIKTGNGIVTILEHEFTDIPAEGEYL